MYKKIIATLLLGIASSFAASWSYFPVKGEGFAARAAYIMEYGDWMSQGIAADARFTLNSKWEFSVRNIGLQLISSDGYNALHQEEVDESGMLRNMILGAKRNLGQKTSVYIDIALPLGSIGTEEYQDAMAIDVGAQRGIILGEDFSWTTELGYTLPFSDYTGMIIHAATEADLSIGGNLIAFAGYEYRIQLSGYASGSAAYKIFGGASIAINERMSIEEEVTFTSTDLKSFQKGFDYNYRYVEEEYGEEGDDTSIMVLKLSTYIKYSF